MNIFTSAFDTVKRFLPRSMKSDPTYSVQAQFFNPGQPIFSSRDYRSFVSNGYRRCVTVYNCINQIAGAAAGINWRLWTDRTMSREITSHPLLDLWRKPNPKQGTGAFIELVFGYWHLAGNSYIYANRAGSNNAPPVELWPLRPDLMKIVAGQSDIAGYVYGYGTNRAQDFDVGQIMHLKFPSYDDEFYGMSPVEAIMQLVDQQNEGNAWNTALMQNAGKPASVFMSKGYLTVEQRQQVRKELLARYSGKRNAGMPMVLEADMSWQAMAMSPYELDWLQSRELNTREIASGFNVAPELVGDSQGKTFANQKEARQALYTENALPKLDRFRDETMAWLVPMYPDLCDRNGNPTAYFTYDRSDIEVLAEIYTATQAAISQQATSLWDAGVCDLYTVQTMQEGVTPDKNGKGIYKIGAILVRSADLQAYAQQALQKPAAPPAPTPENLLNQPPPAPPGLPAPKPKPTGNEENDDESDANDSGADDSSTGKSHPVRVDRRYPPSTPAAAVRRIPASIKVLDLATSEQKQAYAAKMEAARAGWEDKVTSRLQSYFESEQKAVASAVSGCSTDAEVDEQVQNVLSSQQTALQQLIVKLYQDVGEDIGGDTAQQLADATKASRGYCVTKDSAPPLVNLFDAATITYLLSLAGTKVSQISATTLADLRTTLADGVAQGESIPQLAKRVDTLYLQDIIPNRSVTIARTETVAASNYGSLQAAKQSGLTLNKVWLSTEDTRTRQAHADADGQAVPIDGKFTVGGEELDYPGDPAGSPGNIINCRCTPYYKRVQAQSDDSSSDDKMIDFTARKERKFNSVREFMEAVS